jgi:WD40 repeat protein
LALSASSDWTLRLWDVASGESLRTFSGHTGWVSGCAFSPNGRLALSASGDNTLRLWDVASGEALAHWLTDVTPLCCAYGPDGRHVLAGDTLGGVHFLEVMGVEAVNAAVPAIATELAPALPAATQPAPKPKGGVFGWWRRR